MTGQSRRFNVGGLFLLAAGFAALTAPVSAIEWVSFVDETTTRLSGEALRTFADFREKDYAWGDVDNDGDTDLVVVRKEEFTTPGKDVNILFINENGVLTDRTTEFATASLHAGDSGFDTPTNDRDVQLADFDQDGWLDIVTAPTLSDGDPQEIGYPRIYMNLGCTGACNGTDDWLGFRYEPARIPTMLTWHSAAGYNPRFCSVAVGDLDGDDYPDLFFGDYDSGGGQAFEADYNDKLLMNEGATNPGHFVDDTFGNFPGEVSIPGFGLAEFEVSSFGASDVIADMNGDGYNDIVKQTSLNDPFYVGIAYNDPDDEGYFATYDVVNQLSPYFVAVGELNNDDMLDLVVVDDGDDRFLLNQGNGADDLADFLSYLFDFYNPGDGASGDDGFGGDAVIADLDNDGWNDVLIADVDVDDGPCQGTRRMHIYKNLGGNPGDQITLQEQTTGSNCEEFLGNPASCLVTGIPSNQLEGVHDVAVFDINGDGWKDMVLGRCTSTRVWINQPPVGPSGRVPDGNEVPGPQLILDKDGSTGLTLTLTFGDSCLLEDTNYGIYEGTLGDFTSHEQLVCSTAGATTVDVDVEPGGDSYYLVVPTNDFTEGSYGTDSGSVPRLQGADPCHAQAVGPCE